MFDSEIWSDISETGRSAFFHCNIAITTRTMSKTKKTPISCLQKCGRMKNRIVIVLVKVIQKQTV